MANVAILLVELILIALERSGGLKDMDDCWKSFCFFSPIFLQLHLFEDHSSISSCIVCILSRNMFLSFSKHLFLLKSSFKKYEDITLMLGCSQYGLNLLSRGQES